MMRIAAIPVLVLALSCVPAQAAPEGQMTWAVHVTVMPHYALHDALVKSMPGQPTAPSLAESWTTSKDVLTYAFVLRKNVRFPYEDLTLKAR